VKLLSLGMRCLANILEVARGRFPSIVSIETTNHCNAMCRICPRESLGRPKAFMEQTLFEKIVQQCGVNSCSMVHLHNFGEPLLDGLLPDRIRFTKAQGVKRVKIFSNGALLRGRMAEELLDCGLDEIKISVDGGNKEEFERIRVGLRLDEVLRNATTFRNMRDRKGNRTPRIVATCSFTSDRSDTKRMLRGAVDQIIHADPHNWAGARDFPGYLKVRQPCFRLWQTFTILVNGDVALCCLDHSGKEIIGNCADQSITEIWESTRYGEFRRNHRDGKQHQSALCGRCSLSYLQLPSRRSPRSSPHRLG
jgi:radical SAM protein with 4Fe4S-binding SPASM domain